MTARLLAPGRPAPASPPPTSLRSLAALVGGEVRGDALVDSVVVDSHDVTPGSLYCALRGTKVDGHEFAVGAVRAGARALLVERWLPVAAPQLRVPWTRAAVGPVAAAVYGNPADRLHMIGITGTNGKTTTSHLTWSALGSAGRRAGLVGTVGNRFGSWVEPASLTTPDAPHLQRTLAQMAARGADSVVMEVSSQGLDQQRVGGITYQVAVWLNLGHDHLDYHGTIEQYYAAKSELFDADRAEFGLVCVDDEWGVRLAHQARIPVITFGRSPSAQVRVSVSSSDLAGTQIRLTGAGRALRRHFGASDTPDDLLLRAPVVGEMNAENMAAAYLAACASGAPSDDAVAGLAYCQAIPGRFDLVDGGQPFLVIVDYAHTPEAYARLITTARGLAGPGGEVHLVVGCRGDKDRFKRPLTGRVAAEADHPVLTTDDPGDEDPQAILNQVLVGTLDVRHDHVHVEPDRKAAIGHAIGVARDGDVVLIVGRGHERRRRFGQTLEEFDDREVAAHALAEHDYVSHPEQVATYPARPAPLLPDA